MPRAKTDTLTEGMIVAADVMNIDNMLLIPAGSALTERQISILQAWGVDEIDVQGSPTLEAADPMAALSPEEVAKLSDEVRGLFWHADDSNPVFQVIFKAMLQRRARKAAGV